MLTHAALVTRAQVRPYGLERGTNKEMPQTTRMLNSLASEVAQYG